MSPRFTQHINAAEVENSSIESWVIPIKSSKSKRIGYMFHAFSAFCAVGKTRSSPTFRFGTIKPEMNCFDRHISPGEGSELPSVYLGAHGCPALKPAGKSAF